MEGEMISGQIATLLQITLLRGGKVIDLSARLP
jgi:hypothetical protein